MDFLSFVKDEIMSVRISREETKPDSQSQINIVRIEILSGDVSPANVKRSGFIIVGCVSQTQVKWK